MLTLTDMKDVERLPIKSAHKAFEAYHNWSRYMEELLARKIDQVRNNEIVEGMDVMGSLTRIAYEPELNLSNRSAKRISSDVVISDSHILGNAFVMILAGHETTANSILISLLELAINPGPQRQAQDEIQAVFGDDPPEKWNYDSSIDKLLGGMLGAILSEQLRLMPPSVTIPKTVLQDQDIIIDGRKVTFPAGTQLNLVAFGAHRNSRYWPTQPSTISNRPDDLDDFKPERWLIKQIVKDESPTESKIEPSEDNDLIREGAKKSHSKQFRPVPGSYFPFSEGARSCLGRRLAQVEIMAVLAVIFQRYSIELAVDEWASDEDVEAMSMEEKKSLYEIAQKKARQTIRTATSIITLRLHSSSVPFRLVTKGQERFIKSF